MEIKVYSIGKAVVEQNIQVDEKANIQKIFDKIFSNQNSNHKKIICAADDLSILKQYHENRMSFDLREFAEGLDKAERKVDGSRGVQIKEGFLFIKRDTNGLLLLKLENIEVVDIENHYKMKKSFSTEANYYKGCIYKNNLTAIDIIDKNSTIAKYWLEKFLHVLPVRDSYVNSMELIELLKNGELYTDEVVQSMNYKKVVDISQKLLFTKDIFDKEELLNDLVRKNVISQNELKDVFSPRSLELDTRFDISKKAVRNAYKKTIQITEETKIYTDNYDNLIGRQGIEFRDGKIILTVDRDFISKLPEGLRKETANEE